MVYRKEPSCAGHGLGGVSDVVLPHGLAQTAYVEKYISEFLYKYMPTGRRPTADYSGTSCDWIEVAHQLHTSETAIQLSLLSMGLFAAGEPRYALQSYSRALRMLQSALRSPGRVQDDTILATCKLLGLFEVSLLA